LIGLLVSIPGKQAKRLSFKVIHGAFLSENLPMIGADSRVKAIFGPYLSLIKWRSILSHLFGVTQK